MNLLVVLPFYAGDEHMLLDNLAWIKELDGKLGYPCLLACDKETNPEKVKATASEIFSRVDVFQYPRVQHTTWPWPQNNAFMQTAWHVSTKLRMPWLWCETDAIPMCPRWLDILWMDYMKGHKPFGGHWNHSTNVFNGVAIYPPNVAQFSQKAMTAALIEGKDGSGKPYQPPWDAHASSEIKRNLHEMNGVMQHVWQDDATGDAWTFPDRKTVEQVIRPGVVLFHRCKNGSLTAQLRKGRVEPQAVTADVVSLRRNGDIVALLPLLKPMAEKLGRQVRLVVMPEYAPLLEGVSYVEPVLWEGDMEDPLGAAQKFNATNAQVWGRGFKPDIGSNFVKLAWRQLGHRWNRYAPLVFDKRNPNREAELAALLFKTDKPVVLMKMHGLSSPVSTSFIAEVYRWICEAFGKNVDLVEIDDVKTAHIYDLLGLMDRAACCVTVDTATIHLAPATRCPMIQLVNDKPFGASPARGNCLLRMPYSQVVSRLGEIVETVRKCLEPKRCEGMVLVYSNYKASGDVERRELRACSTWNALGARPFPFNGKRTSAGLGDKRAMPYVREMIHEALTSGTEDIVVITNSDISFDPLLHSAIVHSCEENECYWAYRLDKPGGVTDGGADLFAFTRRWWNLHAHLMPDLLHGYRWWDNLLIRLMRWSGCQEQARLYYHEPHANDHRSRLKTHGAAYNERVAAKWLNDHDEKDQKP